MLDNTKAFLKDNTLDILVPNNNGLDTLTVRSVLDYLDVDYKLFDIEKLDYKKLQNTLEKDYYGFNQIQEFDSSKCVITGFYGDEYILRNPYYVQNILKSRGQDLVKIFDAKPDCYMRKFFDLVYREKCKKIEPVNVDKVSQMICNDIQVWHINNTMIFTPFKDKRLLIKYILLSNGVFPFAFLLLFLIIRSYDSAFDLVKSLTIIWYSHFPSERNPDVYLAPPFISQLCCLNLRFKLFVMPKYVLLCFVCFNKYKL